MKPKTCPTCGQVIPQPEGKLICSACGLPILKGQRWHHGGDGRPKHKDCNAPAGIPVARGTMELLA